jgi:hypothetical protein
MVRSPTARPTRRTGSLALRVEKDGDSYVLNTGGAYGGEMHLTGAIRLRLAQPGDELPMLREHDRSRLIGAWTGVRVDGRRVVATGLRWAATADAADPVACLQALAQERQQPRQVAGVGGGAEDQGQICLAAATPAPRAGAAAGAQLTAYFGGGGLDGHVVGQGRAATGRRGGAP